MEKKKLGFEMDVFDRIDELQATDAQLLQRAREISRDAYAPYSGFRVGAAARLANGLVITGTNQENASFPAGLCAERVLLASASAQYPGVPIETIAVSYQSEQIPSNRPISPCGICRQSLQEFQERTRQPIRLILGGMEGKIFVIPDAMLLLPLAFTSTELRR